MTRVKTLFAAASFALFALPFQATAQDIIVGQVLDQSGVGREVGRDYFAGAKVYFDYVNSRGGINGRKILHRIRDDGGDAAKSAALTDELIDRDNANVLFGYFGDGNVRAAIATPAFARSGIAMLGAVSGINPAPGQGERVYFTRAGYAEEARRIVEHFRGIGTTQFALVYAKSEYGTAMRAALGEVLKKSGITPVSETLVDADLRDIGAVARKVASGRPQIVILLTDTLPAASFIKEYREIDAGAFLAGTSLINHRTLLEYLGPAIAHGVLLTQVVPDPGKVNQPLLLEHLRLLKQFLDEPPTHATLEGFIAAKALVHALRAAGPGMRRQDITKALKAMRRTDLGGLDVDFAAAGNRGYSFVDLTLLRRDGRLMY